MLSSWSQDKKVSIDITDQEIHMLWYTKEFPENPTSVIFESLSLAPGTIEQGIVKRPSELSQALENRLKSQGLNKIHAQITIAIPNGFIRKYHLPWVSKRDRNNLIAYLADEEIPIPAEERAYDAWIEEEDSERLQVVLCGIRKDILTALLVCFEAAGYHVSSIGFSSLTWAKALGLNANINTLYLKRLSDHYQFTFYQGNVPKLTRILSVDKDQDPLISSYKDEALKIIDYYFRPFQESGCIKKVILSSDSERTQLGQIVCNYITEKQGKEPVQQIVTEVVFDKYAQKVKDDKYLAVLGRAYQRLDYDNNFLRDKSRSRSKYQRQFIGVVLLMVLSLTGLGVGYRLGGKIERVNSEVHELQARKEKISNDEVLQSNVVREMLTLKEEQSGAGEEMRLLLSLPGEGVEFHCIKYQADQISIDGIALEAVQVQKLLNQLQAIGYKQPHLENYLLEHSITPKGGEGTQRLKFTLKANRTDHKT